MTNVTRYGERTAHGAASFRCAACGELAGVVTAARAGTPADMGPPLGAVTSDGDGLIVDHFIGTTWIAAGQAVLDAVQALIDGGNVDPLALREINRELAPFYCPDCQLNYCRADWHVDIVFDEGFYDYTMGTCPHGHQYVVDD